MFKCLLSIIIVAALVLLTLTLSANASAYGVAITRATVDLVHLQSATAPCGGYDVWLNHAPTCDGCYWWLEAGAVQVFTDTITIDQDIYWSEVGLDAPRVGDCACIYWGTYVTDPIGYALGIRKRPIPHEVFLPIVVIRS